MLIYAYKFGSQGAKALSQLAGWRRIKHNSQTFIGRPRKKVVNWGCSQLPEEVLKCQVVNKPELVALCANKLSFFNYLQESLEDLAFDVSHPAYTTDKGVALAWLDDGKVVVERHKLTGNSGEGIRIVSAMEDLQDCPLYVQYVPKKSEFRIHIINGEVVFKQQKVKRADIPPEQINWKIRNHDGGFIFQQHGIEVPEDVERQALHAVNAIGLDFGAADVVWNEKQGRAYVLEINTAPGLQGTTLEIYNEKLGGFA